MEKIYRAICDECGELAGVVASDDTCGCPKCGESSPVHFVEITDLSDLLDALNSAKEIGGEISFDRGVDMPVFGGAPPADTTNIYSWDADSILYFDTARTEYRICARAD